MTPKLQDLIEPHIHQDLAELPDDIRDQVQAAFHREGWDELNPTQRRGMAREHDDNAYFSELEHKRIDAGRLTPAEIAARLAEQGNLDYRRWLGTVMDAINGKELRLRNPANLNDQLPYPGSADAPGPAVQGYEFEYVEYSVQVNVADVDNWLDGHPEWKIDYRFGGAHDQSAEPIAQANAPAKAARKAWDDNALRDLYARSLEPGMTQKKLAEAEGTTSQNISKYLRKAEDRFSSKGKNAAQSTWATPVLSPNKRSPRKRG